MHHHGTVFSVAIGQILLGLFLAIPMGVAPALFTELFPEDDRLTGYSIVINVGPGVVGGMSPLVTSWLILKSGADLAPVGLLVFASALGIAGLCGCAMAAASRCPRRVPYPSMRR